MKFMVGEGRLTKSQVLYIIRQATEIFRHEGNVLHLKGNFNIVGDIHGQFYDLMKFF